MRVLGVAAPHACSQNGPARVARSMSRIVSCGPVPLGIQMLSCCCRCSHMVPPCERAPCTKYLLNICPSTPVRSWRSPLTDAFPLPGTSWMRISGGRSCSPSYAEGGWRKMESIKISTNIKVLKILFLTSSKSILGINTSIKRKILKNTILILILV